MTLLNQRQSTLLLTSIAEARSSVFAPVFQILLSTEQHKEEELTFQWLMLKKRHSDLREPKNFVLKRLSLLPSQAINLLFAPEGSEVWFLVFQGCYKHH